MALDPHLATVVALAGGARAAERSRLTHSHPDRHMRTELRKVSFGSDDDDGAVRTVALSWITQEPTTALRMTLQIADYGRTATWPAPRSMTRITAVQRSRRSWPSSATRRRRPARNGDSGRVDRARCGRLGGSEQGG